MRTLFYIAIATLLVGCAMPKQPDPIDQLVSHLSSDGAWMNGFFPKIDLPPTASAEQVVMIVLEKDELNIGRVTGHKILEVRPVHFRGLTIVYTAALVQTNVGKKIVFFAFQGPKVGWWSRVYDDKPST
jgi:hypothetical protein